MNRIQKELLAMRKCAGIYLQYRKNPEDYTNNWMFEKKEEGYVDWYKNYRSKLLPFHNKYAEKDCFIIGNGPSLNKMNLELLNDYYTFGLNKIFLMFSRSEFRPKFHVSVNKHVIEQSMDEISKLNIPSFLSISNANKLKNTSNTYYLYTRGGVDKFTGDISTVINEGGTVTFIALQIAFYMGFRRVYLIGVDHNFMQRGNANEEQIMKGEDINHFDPNYFKGQKWNLADLKSSEYAYSLAKHAFEFDDRRICDATIEGKLEIFEKVSFEQALQEARKIR